MAGAVWTILFIFAAIQEGLGVDTIADHKIRDIQDALNSIGTTITIVSEIRKVMAHSRTAAQESIDSLYISSNEDIDNTQGAAEKEIADLKAKAATEGVDISTCLTNEGYIKTICADARKDLIEHLLFFSASSTDNFLNSYVNTTTYFDNYHEILPKIDACTTHDCLNAESAALSNLVSTINSKMHTIEAAFDTSQGHIYENFDYSVHHDTDGKLASVRDLANTITDCIKSKLPQ